MCVGACFGGKQSVELGLVDELYTVMDHTVGNSIKVYTVMGHTVGNNIKVYTVMEHTVGNNIKVNIDTQPSHPSRACDLTNLNVRCSIIVSDSVNYLKA